MTVVPPLARLLLPLLSAQTLGAQIAKQPSVSTSAPIITVLNGDSRREPNGTLEPYEDWRLTSAKRTGSAA